MANTKDTNGGVVPEKIPLPASPPPQHPSSTQPMPGSFGEKVQSGGKATGVAEAPPLHPKESSSAPAEKPKDKGVLDRAFSKENQKTARRFFSAYAQTWVGLSPVWLAGEALTGRKVGTQFNKGRKKLVTAAEEVRAAVATSSHDVVVILDEKLKGDGNMAARAAEVIKAAGENAVLVVTSSLDKLSSQFPPTNGQEVSAAGKGKEKGKQGPQFNLHEFLNEPALKRSMQTHGRDALVLLDKTLKHPVVVTGVSNFARTRGIPHADALLRLASLGLAKIIKVIPEEVKEAAEEAGARIEEIEEIDAEELERRSTQEEKTEAEKVGKVADGPPPKVEERDPYEAMRKKNDCVVM